MKEARTFVIIPCAGTSSRMGFDKILAPLCGQPLLFHTLKALECAGAERTILAVTPGREEEFRALFGQRAEIVAGGASRCESVGNALKALDGENDREDAKILVMVHDGARPFVSKETVLGVKALAEEKGAAIAALPVVNTIKMVLEDGSVSSTMLRSALRSITTPQAFRLQIFRQAYEALSRGRINFDPTDDASLVEASCQKVYTFEDKPSNIKLTTKEDWDYASWLMEKGHV